MKNNTSFLKSSQLGKVITLTEEAYVSEINNVFGERFFGDSNVIYLGLSNKRGYFYGYTYPGVTNSPNAIHDLTIISKCLEGIAQEKYLAATPIHDIHKYLDSLSSKHGKWHFRSCIFNIPIESFDINSFSQVLEKYEED